MKYYWIICICFCISGCAGAQKVNVSQSKPNEVDYSQDEAGIFEAEFYESGAIKRVKSDSKREPFKLFDIIKPDVDVEK